MIFRNRKHLNSKRNNKYQTFVNFGHMKHRKHMQKYCRTYYFETFLSETVNQTCEHDESKPNDQQIKFTNCKKFNKLIEFHISLAIPGAHAALRDLTSQ